VLILYWRIWEMKKNCQLHLYLETNLYEALSKEAKILNISLSELARQKLNKETQLTRIEFRLKEIEKNLLKKRQK
jgi:hypothetical protein